MWIYLVVNLPSKRVVDFADEAVLGQGGSPVRRDQVCRLVFESLHLLTQTDSLRVHEYVEERNRGTSIGDGLVRDLY